MSKPGAQAPRKSRARTVPALRLETIAGGVQLRFPAGSEDVPESLGVLVDGALVGTAPVASLDDGWTFELKLPKEPAGGRFSDTTLVAVSMPDGRVLAPPLTLPARLAIEWTGWAVEAGRVAGGFRVVGDRPSGLPIPVALLSEGVVLHTCFALPAAKGMWRFDHPVPLLPAFGSHLVLTPRVAGLDQDQALVVTAADCGHVGHVDITTQPNVQGWLAAAAEPKRRAMVEIEVEGRRIYRGPADAMRPDLKALGVSDGRSAFRVPFPADLPRDIPLHVSVTVAGTGTHLVGSPYVVPAPPPVMGYFDALEGPFAGGWAIDMHHPGRPLTLEAVCDGQVIGSGLADLFRGDVEKAGMPTARCGFRFLLERPLGELFDRDIQLRVAGTDLVLNGSPRQISQNGNIVRFLTRGSSIAAPALERLMRRVTRETASVRISIVMPVHDTRREWLFEAINSVLAQWSANWELICVDDASTRPHVRQVLETASRHDPRIRVIRSPGNLGIAGATNLGLRAARGNYVAFMDHDDTIEPDAVQKLARAALRTRADLVYSDEAITTEDIGSIIEVRARPAFSHDYYLSHPYFVHMVAVRTEIAHRLGGWDERLPISADVDFILRVIEASKVVAHVPSVLYRWRTHGGSAGHAKQALVTRTMLEVLNGHLARSGWAATAREGLRYNEYRIDWPDDGGEVLIVIPTKNRVDLLKKAIDSIEATSPGENYRIVVIDHDSTEKRTVAYLKAIGGRHTVMPYSGVFNYALMNNLAVKTHGGAAKYLLFLNNDVEAREPGWIARLRSLAARPQVGAVGCLLLYGDDRVQHAGVLVGFSGAADHAMKFQDAYLSKGKRHPGYNCSLTAVRDYSAVTAACMMVKRAAFRAVRGFDEAFVVGFNDTDLCLRIGDAGFKVLYDGQTVLYHHESATRTQTDEVDHPEDDARLRTRWRRYFTGGDPFYSPLLATRGTDHTLRQDGGCRGGVGVRAVASTTDTPGPARKPRLRGSAAARQTAVE